MFFGDSHIAQLYPLIQNLYAHGDLEGRSVVLASGSGCLPDEHLNRLEDGFHCDSFSKFAGMRAEEADVDAVVIGFSTFSFLGDDVMCAAANGKCRTPLSMGALRSNVLTDLAGEIRTLRSEGKKVIVLLPFPIYNEAIPEVALNNAVFARYGLSETPRELTSPSLGDAIRLTAINAGADIYDPRETLCPAGHCFSTIDGKSIYKDDNHLAGSQVNILENSLNTVLHRNLDPAPAPSLP